jgi:predicted nucleic acid-binding protein
MGALNQALLAMAGKKVYLDTNAFIYYTSENPVYFPIVEPIIEACLQQTMFGFTGPAVKAEVMVQPYRSGDADLIDRYNHFFGQSNFLTLVPHQDNLFDQAARLAGKHKLRLIDALHIATAASAGCDFFVTNDSDFKADLPLQIISIKALRIS